MNAQGYPDHMDFTLEDITNRPRILFLGDSFTQGYAAAVGRAYVELIKRRLPQAVIWNASMSGMGTNQAVGTFGRLAPQMQPDLTIYGLYMNDFDDNLYPLESRYYYYNDDGARVYLRSYYLDETGVAHKLPPTRSTVDFTRARRLPVPPTPLRLFGNTRLGSLLLKLRDRVSESLNQGALRPEAAARKATQ